MLQDGWTALQSGWAWMAENSATISAMGSIGLLLIWAIYLQLFLVQFRRGRRPRILITRGAGHGINARCLVGNMSMSPIYVQSIIARLLTPNDDVHADLTESRSDSGDESHDIARLTKQGPVQSAGYMEVARFRDILDDLNRRRGFAEHAEEPATEDGTTVLEVIVFALHGTQELATVASRRFTVEKRDGMWCLSPHDLSAQQHRSTRERRRLVRRWWKVLTS